MVLVISFHFVYFILFILFYFLFLFHFISFSKQFKMKMRIKGNQNLPCEMKLISKRSQLKVNEIKTNWKTFIAFQTEKLRINAKISSVFAPDFWNTQGTITIAQNAYCSRDIYFQFNKVCRSVISWVDAMKAPQRLVALNALGCSLIWSM